MLHATLPANGDLLMNKYCVLRQGDEFKIIYMDRDAAAQWRAEGWELRLRGG